MIIRCRSVFNKPPSCILLILPFNLKYVKCPKYKESTHVIPALKLNLILEHCLISQCWTMFVFLGRYNLYKKVIRDGCWHKHPHTMSIHVFVLYVNLNVSSHLLLECGKLKQQNTYRELMKRKTLFILFKLFIDLCEIV